MNENKATGIARSASEISLITSRGCTPSFGQSQRLEGGGAQFGAIFGALIIDEGVITPHSAAAVRLHRGPARIHSPSSVARVEGGPVVLATTVCFAVKIALTHCPSVDSQN